MVRTIPFGKLQKTWAVLILVPLDDLDMHCSGSLNLSHLTHIVKIYSFKNGPLEEFWGWGGDFSSRMKFPLYDFLGLCVNIFSVNGVHEYFSFNFLLCEYIFLDFAPHPLSVF